MVFRSRRFLFLLVWLEVISWPLRGEVLRVPAHYPTIQAAIDAAGPHDTVLVAEGRYFENIDFRGKRITLSSAFILDGDSGHIRRTIIDGSRFTDSLRRSTITMNACRDTFSVVRGLTVTGGGGSPIFPGTTEHWAGGGILIFNSGAKIADNIIEGNQLHYNYRVNTGGGILAAASDSMVIVVRNNFIRNNLVETEMEADAAGLYAGVGEGGRVLAERNRILHNRVITRGPHQAHGGGVTLFGFYPDRARLIFRDNVVARNLALADPGGDNKKAYGGGINVIYYDFAPDKRVKSPSLMIYDNRILNNRSSERGGGMSFLSANWAPNREEPVCPQVYVSGNVLRENRAQFGAGIHNHNLALVFVENALDNDLSIEGSREIYNADLLYSMLNMGIINLYQNQVAGGIKETQGIRGEYPVVYSHAHRWKVTGRSPEEISMRMIPPFWRQWWAISLYVVAISLLLWLYQRYLYYRIHLREALKLERKEKERMRQLDQVRTRFFANVSHEFRTPLTLIDAPLQELLGDNNLSGRQLHALTLMQDNVNRMQHLIRQLLDLAKLDAGAIRVQVVQGDPGERIRGMAASYESLAGQRQISCSCHTEDAPSDAWFDPDKLEQIVHNLLSNAFKFGRAGDRVKISLTYRSEANPGHLAMIVEVADTGPGLDEDQKERLFERFYRGGEGLRGGEGYRSGESYRSEREGSGIGLALVQELVDVCRGTIHVASAPGEGTSFRVVLPCGEKDFDSEEKRGTAEETGHSGDRSGMYVSGAEEMSSDVAERISDTRDLPAVLIVEDNEELRKYMAMRLETDLRILQAEHGRTGLEKAIDRRPDLIISDLMMPVMDGAELVERLRNDERTCHIPLIMLTARGDMESKLDCFERGSDAFMEKPFRMEELRVRVHQLIGERRMLREHYLRRVRWNDAEEESGPSKPEFLSHLEHCIQQRLGDPDLNVEELSREMNLSRVQLYRKVQHLTGMSPGELIRNTRLASAARLLRNGAENITQVMLEVGFSSASHFTTSFRRLYGCSPSEYREKTAEV